MHADMRNITDQQLASLLREFVQQVVSKQPRINPAMQAALLELVVEIDRCIHSSGDDRRERMRQLLAAMWRILSDRFGVESADDVMSEYYEISIELKRRVGLGKPQHLIDKYGC